MIQGILQVCTDVFTVASGLGLALALLLLVDGSRSYGAVKDTPSLRLTAQLWVGVGAVAAIGEGKLFLLGLLVVWGPTRVTPVSEVILPLYAGAAVAVCIIASWVLAKRAEVRSAIREHLRLRSIRDGGAAVILDNKTLTVAMWSLEATQLFGWAPAETIGHPMGGWLISAPWAPIDDWLLVKKSITDDDGRFLAVARTRQGGEVVVSAAFFVEEMAARDIMVAYFQRAESDDISK